MCPRRLVKEGKTECRTGEILDGALIQFAKELRLHKDDGPKKKSEADKMNIAEWFNKSPDLSPNGTKKHDL